jgi:sec-independent protein translocase protein TatC
VAWKRIPRRLRPGEEATLVEHLGELRSRLFIAIGSVAVAFVFVFIFHGTVIEWLSRPLPEDRALVTFGVTEPFFTAIKVSFFGAFALALPIVLHQLWSFLAPAVEEQTQRILVYLTLMSTLLFAFGLALAYVVVLPQALLFLTSFDEQFYDVQIRASYYFSFVSLVLVGMGLIFQLPIFVLALVRVRVLSSARMRRNRRVAIFFIVAFIAVLLPTVDPVSLALESIPMLLLYEVSIWLAVIMERRWGLTPTDDTVPAET